MLALPHACKLTDLGQPLWVSVSLTVKGGVTELPHKFTVRTRSDNAFGCLIPGKPSINSTLLLSHYSEGIMQSSLKGKVDIIYQQHYCDPTVTALEAPVNFHHILLPLLGTVLFKAALPEPHHSAISSPCPAAGLLPTSRGANS